MARGLDDDDQSVSRNRQLLKAVLSNNDNLARSLLHSGVDFLWSDPTDRGSSAIHVAAKSNACECAELLVNHAKKAGSGQKKLLLEQLNRKSETAVHVAAKYGHVKMVELLLAAADYMPKESFCAFGDIDGNTPLHTACSTGDAELVDTLIMMGGMAVLELKNRVGDRPLHVAAAAGRLEVVSRLIAAGSDLNRHNNAGQVSQPRGRMLNVCRWQHT